MNDKFKGLVLGLSLGALLTGSVAYASGTQIEVFFRDLKFKFDGIEKAPTADQGGPGFIHNGTTYVPLRFVSEALGKEVNFDEDTGTVWVGKRIEINHPVALFKGGQITQGELQTRMALDRAFGYASEEHAESHEYQQYLLEEMIVQRILSSRLDEAGKTAAAADVEKEIAFFQTEFASSSRIAADLNTRLAEQGLSEKDFHAFVEQLVFARRALTASIPEDKLKASYDERAASGDLHIATVRHILIGFEDAQGKERTKEEAKAKAQQIVDKLRSGADFAELAKKESEDPGSKDNGGLYKDAPINQWVEPFKKATKELSLDSISDPVETTFGYHIIRVESRGVLSFEQEKETLLAEELGDAYSNFISKELPGLIQKIDLPE